MNSQPAARITAAAASKATIDELEAPGTRTRNHRPDASTIAAQKPYKVAADADIRHTALAASNALTP
jgi:hypothetical protein